MAVVRGDRVGESATLNRVSLGAQTFYSAFVAAVPDDFGRFRVAPSHIWTAMYPRREPKPSDLRWVLRMVLELCKADAFLVYEVDGQQFAEVAKWKPTGNMVHRCPEPPTGSIFMPHEHTGRCLSTAISRAKEWGTPEEAVVLINRLNEIKTRKAIGKPTGKPTGKGTPVNPSIRQSVQESTDTDLSAIADVREVVEFYNRATGRGIHAETHDKFIRPRLRERVPKSRLKLAVIGACLSAHHLGFNERENVYLDPETIFKAGRVDGHAAHARGADYRLPRASDVWGYWRRQLELPSDAAVMEHFFRLRDEVVAQEGGKPRGPAAAYSSGYKLGDTWPERSL